MTTLSEHLSALGFERPYEGSREVKARIPGEHGFFVEVTVLSYEGGNGILLPCSPSATVALSHQCDSWEIAWGSLLDERLRAFSAEFDEARQLVSRLGDLTQYENDYKEWA